jgi:hypothetical protein
MSFAIRLVGDSELHRFETRNEAFDWARENVRRGKMFALLEYDSRGTLESMNRFTFDGRRMLMENITR